MERAVAPAPAPHLCAVQPDRQIPECCRSLLLLPAVLCWFLQLAGPARRGPQQQEVCQAHPAARRSAPLRHPAPRGERSPLPLTFIWEPTLHPTLGLLTALFVPPICRTALHCTPLRCAPPRPVPTPAAVPAQRATYLSEEEQPPAGAGQLAGGPSGQGVHFCLLAGRGNRAGQRSALQQLVVSHRILHCVQRSSAQLSAPDLRMLFPLLFEAAAASLPATDLTSLPAHQTPSHARLSACLPPAAHQGCRIGLPLLQSAVDLEVRRAAGLGMWLGWTGGMSNVQAAWAALHAENPSCLSLTSPPSALLHPCPLLPLPLALPAGCVRSGTE